MREVLQFLAVLGVMCVVIAAMYFFAWLLLTDRQRPSHAPHALDERLRRFLEGQPAGASADVFLRQRFEGYLPGSTRSATVEFERDETGGVNLILTIATEDTPYLRVSPETAETRRAKELGLAREIEVGEPGFDEKFLLETPDA